MIIVLINVLVPDLNTTRTHHLLHPDRYNLIIFVIVLFYLVPFLYVWLQQSSPAMQRQYIKKLNSYNWSPCLCSTPIADDIDPSK